MKVTVFGAGYVGLVTGACLSELGHSVTCVDIDQSKVDSLTKGQIPIYEPGLSDIVLRSVEAERLLFTTNAADAIDRSEILMVAVGTPQDKDGQADLQYVLKVAEQIGDQMKDYKLVVVKSTVPVGTCEKVRKTIQARLDARGLNVEFDIASNPEFLKEGSAVSDFQRPDRIVIGTNSEKATQMLSRLYRHFVQNGYRLVSMDVVSSELTKYASNAMLATKISFMNELSRMSEEVGADINAIRQGMGSDQRIGYHFIYAGLGYGGSCFPKDVKALIGTGRSMDIEMPLLSAVDEVNQRQRQYFIKNFLAYFDNDLAGKKVTLWGLSFKPNTDDVREAPSKDIAEALLAAGADVHAHDPVATEAFKREASFADKLTYHKDQYKALEGSDALILVTEWKPFRAPDFERMKELMRSKVIFDGRNQYDPQVLSELGFNYVSVGRPRIQN